MRTTYSLAVSAILALSALSVQAQGEATVSISPDPGNFDTLPTEFVLTINGPKTLSKAIGKNQIKVTDPNGTGQQLSGTVSGNTVTCKFNATSTFKFDIPGNYTVTFVDRSIKYTWEDGTTSYSAAQDYIYTVKGNESEDPNQKKEVQYDITLKSTTPKLANIDLEMLNIDEGLQINFSQSGLILDPDSNPTVTIVGPNFNQTTALTDNRGMNFIARFPSELVCSGDYTLTIPKGVVGDADWIEDHQYGHANEEIVYHFTAINGIDPSTITQDLTFNPIPTPPPGKVNYLKRVTFEFASTPYWNPETVLTVKYQPDRQQTTYLNFGTATIERGLDNNAVLVIEPSPTEGAQFVITIPEGTFWDGAHELDPEAGSMNGELNFKWDFQPAESVTLSVTGHIPATDEKVASFKADEIGIVIKTDNNAAVDKLELEVTGYKLNDDMGRPETIINTTSTFKNSNGEICWVNETGNDIKLSNEYYYEVSYKLLDASNVVLKDGSFEFYGDSKTGIQTINADGTYVIFNTQGIKVNSTVDQLPAGLYIINGQKKVIR